MKVLLKRNMFLDGVLYEPNADGTVLPDKIGDRVVKLYDPKNPPKIRRDPRVLFEALPDGTGLSRVKDDNLVKEADDDKKVIWLPEDTILWSDEAAKVHTTEGPLLTKGHPQTTVPLSALTPGLSKAEQEANIKKDMVKNIGEQADKEKELLDAPVVGKK